MKEKLKYKDILSLDDERNVVNIDVSPEVAHNATQGVINHLKETAERLKTLKLLQQSGFNVSIDGRIYNKKK